MTSDFGLRKVIINDYPVLQRRILDQGFYPENFG